MKILVSGAGIAGNALAFWLARLGHAVTVVERFADLRDTGLQIDLRGAGVEVLRRMGLEQEFRDYAAPEQGDQIIDGAGRRWAYFPVTPSTATAGGEGGGSSGGGRQSYTSEFEIMRGDLCRLLRDAALQQKTPPKYVFGTSVTGFEQDDDAGVTVKLTDGTSDRFDLLVGADGQWSRTRRLMRSGRLDQPDDAFRPVHGQHIAYFTLPWPIKDGESYDAATYITTKQRTIVTRRHRADTVQAYLVFRTDSERLKQNQGNMPVEKEVLTEIFRDAGWRADEILAGMQDADDFYLERLGLVKLDAWSRGGRIVLLGDAAFCPTANTGMGTTCAVVGAYVLAGEIGKRVKADDDSKSNSEGLAAALATYEETFRPFTDHAQKGVLETRSPLLQQTMLGVLGIRSLMALTSRLPSLNLERFFLREDVKDWSLPEYEEMLRG